MDNFANLICIKLANLQNLKDTECILGMPQNATGRPLGHTFYDFFLCLAVVSFKYCVHVQCTIEYTVYSPRRII